VSWTVVSDAVGLAWTSRAGNQVSGKRAARLDLAPATSYVYIYQSLPLCATVPYLFSLYARQGSADADCSLIQAYGGLGIGVPGNQIKPLTTTYQKIEEQLINDGTATQALAFQITCNGPAGSNGFRTSYVDDLVLQPANTGGG
jgi:hypothetical protein